MGRSPEHDWLNAEIHFIVSPERLTLKDIADQFEIPYQSVRRYASKNNWNEKRSSTQCVIKNATRLKFCEIRYGLKPRDITGREDTTWMDLAYLQCERVADF